MPPSVQALQSLTYHSTNHFPLWSSFIDDMTDRELDVIAAFLQDIKDCKVRGERGIRTYTNRSSAYGIKPRRRPHTPFIQSLS
jgi:hypothetical protein